MEHLEGTQSVLAALSARQRRFQSILIRHGSHAQGIQEVVEIAGQLGVPIRYVSGEELGAMAHGATHGGVLAVCSPKPRMKPAELVELIDRLTEPPLLLLLEGIEDARNLGFTLRSGEALGVHAVLIKKHLWDFDPVEIARPASGAYERMPLAQIEGVELLMELKGKGIQLIGCIANAKRMIYESELNLPTILAIGGEKRGLSGAVRAICDQFTSIPARPGAASLSLSHAAAVILAEAMRQRRLRAASVSARSM